MTGTERAAAGRGVTEWTPRSAVASHGRSRHGSVLRCLQRARRLVLRRGPWNPRGRGVAPAGRGAQEGPPGWRAPPRPRLDHLQGTARPSGEGGRRRAVKARLRPTTALSDQTVRGGGCRAVASQRLVFGRCREPRARTPSRLLPPGQAGAGRLRAERRTGGHCLLPPVPAPRAGLGAAVRSEGTRSEQGKTPRPVRSGGVREEPWAPGKGPRHAGLWGVVCASTPSLGFRTWVPWPGG